MFNFNKNGIHVVKYRVLWMCLSAVLLLPGIVAMIYSMVNYPTHSPVKVGIDYTGGSILQYETSANVDHKDVGTIQANLTKAIAWAKAVGITPDSDGNYPMRVILSAPEHYYGSKPHQTR